MTSQTSQKHSVVELVVTFMSPPKPFAMHNRKRPAKVVATLSEVQPRFMLCTLLKLKMIAATDVRILFTCRSDDNENRKDKGQGASDAPRPPV